MKDYDNNYKVINIVLVFNFNFNDQEKLNYTY